MKGKLAALAFALALATSCILDSGIRGIDANQLQSYGYRVFNATADVALNDVRVLVSLSEEYEGKTLPDEIELMYDGEKCSVKTGGLLLSEDGSRWILTNRHETQIIVGREGDREWNYERTMTGGYVNRGTVSSGGLYNGAEKYNVEISGTYEVYEDGTKELESTFITEAPIVFVRNIYGSSGALTYYYTTQSGVFRVNIWKDGKPDHWCRICLPGPEEYENPSYTTDLDD